MIAIAIWVICSFVIGLLAHALGRFGVGWVMFSMMFSPSLALLLIAILDKKTPKPRMAQARTGGAAAVA